MSTKDLIVSLFLVVNHLANVISLLNLSDDITNLVGYFIDQYVEKIKIIASINILTYKLGLIKKKWIKNKT